MSEMVMEPAGIEMGRYTPDGVSWHTLVEVGLHFDDESKNEVPADHYSGGALHATMGGRCIVVPPDMFWSWACGLVGSTVVGEVPRHRETAFLDFDLMESSQADQTRGLHIYRTVGGDWKTVREVTLSVGEFWDALCELSKDA